MCFLEAVISETVEHGVPAVSTGFTHRLNITYVLFCVMVMILDRMLGKNEESRGLISSYPAKGTC